MIRTVVYLLVTILIITFLRAVIGLILRTVANLLNSPPERQAKTGPKSASGVRVGGELKQDPVCGTFVSASSSIKKSVGGDVVHFCSSACRDKFQG